MIENNATLPKDRTFSSSSTQNIDGNPVLTRPGNPHNPITSSGKYAKFAGYGFM